jgi:hypothetical protein
MEAVEKRLEHARQKNLSPSYIRTLERLKNHWQEKKKPL